jgi:tetratricopeptide (TPR) repeat protein
MGKKGSIDIERGIVAVTKDGRYAQVNSAGHTRSMENLNQAIKLNAADYAAYCERALLYAEKGDTQNALADYTRAIELNPNNVPAHSDRGTVYLQMGDYTRAIADFTKAIKLDPAFVAGYFNRGTAYHKKRLYS